MVGTVGASPLEIAIVRSEKPRLEQLACFESDLGERGSCKDGDGVFAATRGRRGGGSLLRVRCLGGGGFSTPSGLFWHRLAWFSSSHTDSPPMMKTIASAIVNKSLQERNLVTGVAELVNQYTLGFGCSWRLAL